MAGLTGKNIEIAKTIKLYINGEFPRTESGRSYPVLHKETKSIYAHLCLSSRKDFRNAVTAAREAQLGWQSKSAYLKGQILYRMAEMMEGKKNEVALTLSEVLGLSRSLAEQEVEEAISALVYYAGFSDKYQQLIGSVNPVSGPHHNFTTPEALGTVGAIFSKNVKWSELVAAIAAMIVSGNAVVALLEEESAINISVLGEIMQTSDLPKGVVNLLSGKVDELYKHFGSHMEVQGITYLGDDSVVIKTLAELGAENVKRLVLGKQWPMKSLETILNFVEYKTVWHPISF